MAFRSSQVWIQQKTKARLRLIAEMYPFKSRDENVPGHNATADELADTLLNQLIEKQYPQVIQMEKELEGIKKKYAAEGGNKVESV